MAIILPRRFTSQPKYSALLDKNHPLAQDVTLALNCYNPYVNTVHGGASGLTPGGSGFSLRDTEQGHALWTPNGGWADFAVNEDWAGPNTIIALCRVNDADNPWGGLFSKNSSGTTTQFAVGRFSSEDFIYGSVDDATALKYGGSSNVSTLTGINALTFTHSGVASTGKSYYVNGSLIGTTAALGTQPTGTGPLGLGRGRDSNASFDSDVDWVAFVRFKRVLSATEIAEVSSNVWALWAAPGLRLVESVVVAGDSVGSASGASTVSGTGASVNAQPGSASGTSTVSGIGASTANSVAASSGTSTVSGVGNAAIDAVGSASGTSTVDGVGTSSTGSSGSAAGTSSVSGVGSSTAESVGSATGSGLASGIGSAIASSSGAASGSSVVSGVGEGVVAGSAVGEATGASTASGVGASVVAAVGSASGSSTALAVSDNAALPEREAGGDDAPVRVVYKKRKKTLEEQPNKHLESIFEKVIKEFKGEVEKPVEGTTTNPAPVKTLSVKTPAEGTTPVKADKEQIEAERELLALYQEQVRLVQLQDDEELLMLIAEMI